MRSWRRPGAAGVALLLAAGGVQAALDEADVLARINAYRAAGARCGSEAMPAAPPLAWNVALERAATVQARHMARSDGVTLRGTTAPA